MKLDLSSFDETLLKKEPKEPFQTLWRLRDILKAQQALLDDKMSDETQMALLETDFMHALQKLVNSSFGSIVRVALSAIKDLFNAVCERIEKIQKDTNKEDILLLMNSAIALSAQNLQNEKAESVKFLAEYLEKEEDLQICAAGYELLIQIGMKKQLGISFPLIFADQQDRTVFLAYAPNLLRSKEHHFTLIDIAIGHNKSGHKLIDSDLIFEIESQPTSLNESTSTKTVIIPRERILNSQLTARELATEISNEQALHDSEPIVRKLEAKIAWLRYVKSDESLLEALQSSLSLLFTAYLSKSEARHPEFISYLKDRYLTETIQLISESGNKELVLKAFVTLHKLIQRDQGGYINLEQMTKAQKDTNTDEPSNSFLVRILEDCASITLEEDCLEIIKKSNTSLLNAQIVKSSQVQFYSATITLNVLKIIQPQNARSSSVLQDTILKCIPTCLKVLNDIPVAGQYAYDSSVVAQFCQILKFCSRPRHEEQFEIIKKIEARIVYEFKNLENSTSVVLEEEGQPQIQDQKEKQSVYKILLSILSELIARDLILLVGQLCSDSPAITPTLIRNGVLPSILKSLESRIPNSPDMLDSLIFSINQMSLQEEGQALILASDVFSLILKKIMDQNYTYSTQHDNITFKIYLCNLFDRNAEFKNKAKQAAIEYFDFIERICNQQAIKYFEIIRQQDVSMQNKVLQIKKLQSQMTQQNSQILACISMIHNFSFLSNDNMQQSRHTQDIFTADIFQRVFQAFIAITSLPIFSDMVQSFQKIMKSLVEHTNFVQNIPAYFTLFQQQIDLLNLALNEPIFKIKEFDFEAKDQDKQFQPLDQFDLKTPELYLQRGELTLIFVSRIYSMIKTTQTLHNATQHQMIQNVAIHKVTKFVFYFQRICRETMSKVFIDYLNLIKTSPENEEQKKDAEIMFSTSADKLSAANESVLSYITSQSIIKRAADTQIFAMKENILTDFISKLSANSFQMRHNHEKDALEKNLFLIGKLVYKLTKQLNSKQLIGLNLEEQNDQTVKSLFKLCYIMRELSNASAHTWLDGASFYMLFKKGGIKNFVEFFHWLADKLVLLNKPQTAIFNYLLIDCCKAFKSIMLAIIGTKSQDSSINSLLNTNFGSDFDNAKNLFQTFYHALCTDLFQLNLPASSDFMLKLKCAKCPYLLEIVSTTLIYATKGFSNCQLLKDGLRNERDQHRRGGAGRNQADPDKSNQLLNMGMGFTREKINQALIQSNNDLNNAMNLLMEWQMQNDLGLNEVLEQNIEDGYSSNESDMQDSSVVLSDLDKNMTDKTVPKVKKVVKVTEDDFDQIVRKTQQQGFNWMIELYKDSSDSNEFKLKEKIGQLLLSEKTEQVQKQMYASIDEIFKRDLEAFLLKFEIMTLWQESSDQEMKEIDTSISSPSQLMQKLSSDLSLIYKIIANQKAYLKEAVLKSDVFLVLIQALHKINDSQRLEVLLKDTQSNHNFQRLLLDILTLLFSIIQLSNLQVSIYATSKIHQDVCQKKIKVYQQKVPVQELLKPMMNLLSNQVKTIEQEQKGLYKKAIVSTAAQIALKILMSKDVDQALKIDVTSELFKIVTSIKQPQVIDQRILFSIFILFFENSKTLQCQMEKLVSRVLYMKYETQAKNSKDPDSQSYLLTKTNFNGFLKYFSPLQIRDTEGFKQVLKENCEIKTVKKANTLSQDSATINLKEAKLAELKKIMAKERAGLKQITKVIDFQGGDKQAKIQAKSSRKQLLATLNESQIKAIEMSLTTVYEKSQIIMAEYNEFLTLQATNQRVLKTKEQASIYSGQDIQAIIEILFKLSNTYPAVTVAIIQFKPAGKRSFLNWLIKDFLTILQLKRNSKEVPNPQEDGKSLCHISYQARPELPATEKSIIEMLNNLTAYNHLMTLSEQTVKHEVRTKLMLESLSVLQKAMKDKNQNQSIQKVTIQSTLKSIHALLCYDSTLIQKQKLIAQDNFFNSMKVAVVREAATKDTLLQPSFIKLSNELLSEVIDPTLSQNSEIVAKCISILKQMAEFVNIQKKKEEKISLKNKEQEGSINLQHMENVQIQPVAEANQVDWGVPNDAQMPNEESDQSENDQMNNPQPDIFGDDQQDDEDDEEDEEDEDDEEMMEDGEEEEEEDDNDIVNDGGQLVIVHEDENDADMFDVDAEDDEFDSQDEEEIILQDRAAGDRRARQFDIINDPEPQRVPEPNNRWGVQRHYELAPDPRRGQDWTEEEFQIQQILRNLRTVQSLDQHAALAERVVNDPWAGNPPAQANQKKTFIEQMYEGIQLITEQVLLDILKVQRQNLETELKEDAGYIAASDLPSGIGPRGGRLDEADLLNAEFDFPNLERMGHPIPQYIRAAAEGWEDVQLMIQNPLGGNPFLHRLQDLEMRLGAPPFFGGHPPPHHRIAQPHFAEPESALFTFFQRNQQQVQSNLNEGLGQDLLELMEVQVEEVKQEEAKRESSPKLIHSPQLSAELSNQQLISAFFSDNNPGAGIAAASQVDEERQRVEERSRELRVQIEQQQQDIQNIVISSQRRNDQEPNAAMIQASDPQHNLSEQLANINLQRSASSEQIPQELEQIPIQQPEQIQIQQQEQIQIQQPVLQQPVQIQAQHLIIEDQIVQQEEIKQQEEQQQQQPSPNYPLNEPAAVESNMTFGYDNELLLAYGIDPTILHELPEELRAELLAQIDVPPVQQQQQQPAQQQQQPSAAHQQQPGQEEQKQPEQNNQPGGGNSLANDLGIDPEFLANLPEDMQLELLQNEQFRQRNLGQQPSQAQPVREAEQMDIASFIATVTDPNLRREIFAGMDEATMATLPPNLMAEARRFQDQLRAERNRARDQFANMDQRVRGMIDQIDPMRRAARGGGAGMAPPYGRDDLLNGVFGNRHRGGEDNKQQEDHSKQLDDIIATRHQQICEEQTYEEVVSALTSQITGDERPIDVLLMIMMASSNVKCELIPCLQALVKIQVSNVPVLRNKIINAMTYLLKTLGANDKETINQLFPGLVYDNKKAILLLIGCLRILLKNNRSLMKFILKGLIAKEDNQQHQKNNQILKKQAKVMKSQATAQEEVSAFDDSAVKKQNTQLLPPLAEIFYLIRADIFKNDKPLLKNLSMLIQQILKQFDIALEELENCKQAISPDTIQSIAEVLSLDIIDQTMMQDLGEFLFQISKKKKENFDMISLYCRERSGTLIEALSQKLKQASEVFSEIRSRISPGKMQMILSQSPSQDGQSVYEEEKSDMVMIDTSNSNPLEEMKQQESKTFQIKLPEEDEKLLKQSLKVQENSDVLLRIFKLFNLFYEKFTSEKIPAEGSASEVTNPEGVTKFVHDMYQSQEISGLVKRVNEVLRMVYKTNLEISEGVSNLIFCVFATYYPELLQSMMHEEAQAKLEKENKDESKYQIKMLPINESLKRQERFVLFRNKNYFNPRIEELSNFCQANKRLINKLIKTKTANFVGEMEGLFKYMPNLLDFENKRIYFKRELAKLKRNQYYDQIQLFIRRDNIFMDSYAQLGVREASEMKGKLHIQFTGERGQDAGGLTRDFFIELSREMFNANYSLFNLSSSGSTYYPNPKSYVERDHLRYFKFIGRIIGKALFDECLLECYFVKSLYKIMTGEPLTFQDLEDFDNEFFNNLKWCLENDITPLYATFVAEQDFFGRAEDFELIPKGRDIGVTNENKDLYIEKLTQFKLYTCIKKQIDAFLEGFYELIPKDLIGIFNHKELELLISGLPTFDLNDLRQNTEYQSYSANSPQVLWLWEILESFENSERAEFLQFVTGSSKVPLDGFKGLMGMRGPQKFTVAKIKTDDILRLPSGHTCFNQIDIPEYPSKEIMHERVLTAIKETKGFGFA